MWHSFSTLHGEETFMQLADRDPVESQKRRKQKKRNAKKQIKQAEKLKEGSGGDHNEARLQKNLNSLMPRDAIHNVNDTIEVNLDKTDILNLLDWIKKIFKINFLTGDAFTPPGPGKIAGNLITYKTQRSMTKRQVWDLFLSFLDLFNVTLVPNQYLDGHPISYTVLPSDQANQAPLPVFIGINWRDLPDNDTKIRFVYFVENSQLATLNTIAQDFKSKSGIVQPFEDLNALIFSDKSSNIRSIMAILSELDNVSMPEALSVLKLKHANAEDVVSLYENLVAREEQKTGIAARLFGAKKQSTTAYFPEDTKLIAEPRTNALIILGTRASIEKVEDFILNYVDTELQQPYSPLYVYDLQYANSDNIAQILNQVTAFAPNSKAAIYGGVRDGNKFFRQMQFISEPSGNRLLIRAEKEDYLKVRTIIEQLDVKQPQIAIEVLVVNVNTSKLKSLGSQIRTKTPGFGGSLGTRNIDFQNSGITGGNISGIITTEQGGLMGDLIQLAQGQNPGTTLLSIGNNVAGGVWALFKMLETYTYSSLVSYPFLTTTNKFTARVSLGETRRVSTGTVQSNATVNTQADLSANLTVEITPQINSDGIINLEIRIDVDTFTDAIATSATRNTKTIKTSANVANKEILAIGGLLQNQNSDATTEVPLLGKIPILGWFFKNKNKAKNKSNLLVFISPQIVLPMAQGGIGNYTVKKADYSKNVLRDMRQPYEQRDPIHRWFFKDRPDEDTEKVEFFLHPQSPCLEPGKVIDCRINDVFDSDLYRCRCTGQTCKDKYTCAREPRCLAESNCIPSMDKLNAFLEAEGTQQAPLLEDELLTQEDLNNKLFDSDAKDESKKQELQEKRNQDFFDDSGDNNADQKTLDQSTSREDVLKQKQAQQEERNKLFFDQQDMNNGAGDADERAYTQELIKEKIDSEQALKKPEPEDIEFVQQETPRAVKPLDADEKPTAVSSHAVTISKNESQKRPLAQQRKRKSIMEFLPGDDAKESKEVRTC